MTIADSKIIQIMPCENVWIRYRDKENPGEYFYSKAECLALFKDSDGYTHVQYIDMDDFGMYDESDLNQDGIVHTDIDLSREKRYWSKSGRGELVL